VATVKDSFYGAVGNWLPTYCWGWNSGLWQESDLYYRFRIPFGAAIRIESPEVQDSEGPLRYVVASRPECAETNSWCKCHHSQLWLYEGRKFIHEQTKNIVFDDSDEKNPDGSVDVFVVMAAMRGRDVDSKESITFNVLMTGCLTDLSGAPIHSFCPECSTSLTVREDAPVVLSPPELPGGDTQMHSVGYECPQQEYCGRKYLAAVHGLPKFARVESDGCKMKMGCSFEGTFFTDNALGCIPELTEDPVDSPGNANDGEGGTQPSLSDEEQSESVDSSLVEIVSFLSVPLFVVLVLAAFCCFRFPSFFKAAKTAPMPGTEQQPSEVGEAEGNVDTLLPPTTTPLVLLTAHPHPKAVCETREEGEQEDDRERRRTRNWTEGGEEVSLSSAVRESPSTGAERESSRPCSLPFLPDSSPLISEVARFFLEDTPSDDPELPRRTFDENLPVTELEGVGAGKQSSGCTEEEEEEDETQSQRASVTERGHSCHRSVESVGLLHGKVSRRSFFFLRLELFSSPPDPQPDHSSFSTVSPTNGHEAQSLAQNKSAQSGTSSAEAKNRKTMVLHLDELPIITLLSSSFCYVIGVALLVFLGISSTLLQETAGGLNPLSGLIPLDLIALTLVLIVCQCVSLFFPPRCLVASSLAWVSVILATGFSALSAAFWKGYFRRGPWEGLLELLVSSLAYALLCYPSFVRRQLPRGFSRREAETLLRLHRKQSRGKVETEKGGGEELDQRPLKIQEEGGVKGGSVVEASHEQTRRGTEEADGIRRKEEAANTTKAGMGESDTTAPGAVTLSAEVLSAQTFGFSHLAFHSSECNELHRMWQHTKRRSRVGGRKTGDGTETTGESGNKMNRCRAAACGRALSLVVRFCLTSLGCCRLTFASPSRLESARLFLATVVGLSVLSISSTVAMGTGLLWWTVPSTALNYPSADVWSWGNCSTVSNDPEQFDCAIPGGTSVPAFLNGSSVLAMAPVTWASRVDFGGFVLVDMPAEVPAPHEGSEWGLVHPGESRKRHRLLLPTPNLSDLADGKALRRCDELTVEYFDWKTFLELNQPGLFEKGCGRGDLFSKVDFQPTAWCEKRGGEVLKEASAWDWAGQPHLLVCPVSQTDARPVFGWILLGLSPVILLNVVFMEKGLLNPRWADDSLRWASVVLVCVLLEVSLVFFAVRGYLRQRHDALSFLMGRDDANSSVIFAFVAGILILLVSWKVGRLAVSQRFKRVMKACKSMVCQKGADWQRCGVAGEKT